MCRTWFHANACHVYKAEQAGRGEGPGYTQEGLRQIHADQGKGVDCFKFISQHSGGIQSVSNS